MTILFTIKNCENQESEKQFPRMQFCIIPDSSIAYERELITSRRVKSLDTRLHDDVNICSNIISICLLTEYIISVHPSIVMHCETVNIANAILSNVLIPLLGPPQYPSLHTSPFDMLHVRPLKTVF